ncbi:hypothetical protein C2E23DRAFT_864710 [Lenzites betulinus]|nr:hypothetical protein C2E23DRAFT_864710 [Lenzites betulinus]
MTATGVETQTAPAGAETGAEQVSPQAAALRSMFPDFDVAVLQSVLDSVNGDQERAIDLLLGMSDPDYVSTQPVPQAADPALDLDEQLARQLMLEDQQQQQQQRHAQGYSWPRRDQADVPYQARQAPGGNQGRMPPAEGRSDFQELQRTMGQIAESGKRTFSSIVSKVKAKINEYETNKSPGQPSNAPAAPQWGAAPAPQLDRHTASQAYQPNYYYGTEPSPTAEQPISLNGPAAPRAQQQVQGYDLDSAPAIVAPVPVPAAAPTTPPPAAAARLSPAASPRPSSGDVPRPPATSSGSPVNAAKIGLLPKRPVSLLSAGSPPATRPSDDDELEYVENPFEDRK